MTTPAGATDPTTVQEVRNCLSPARMMTYDTAVAPHGGSHERALALYAWNAEVSSALLTPLHICEVVIRNAISDAIEPNYGPRWPWSSGFARSLPNPPKGYNPVKDLNDARRNAPTTGKVIPELKFVFWQKMFTSRHDARLWNPHLHNIFPNLDPARPVSAHRIRIYNDLERIRGLRNRIAHHEPIFTRDLRADLAATIELVNFRSTHTGDWVKTIERVTNLLDTRPV